MVPAGPLTCYAQLCRTKLLRISASAYDEQLATQDEPSTARHPVR